MWHSIIESLSSSCSCKSVTVLIQTVWTKPRNSDLNVWWWRLVIYCCSFHLVKIFALAYHKYNIVSPTTPNVVDKSRWIITILMCLGIMYTWSFHNKMTFMHRDVRCCCTWEFLGRQILNYDYYIQTYRF